MFYQETRGGFLFYLKPSEAAESVQFGRFAVCWAEIKSVKMVAGCVHPSLDAILRPLDVSESFPKTF